LFIDLHILELNKIIEFSEENRYNVGPEDLQDQEEACQEGEAEPSHPPVDQNENWKHHPLQRQEETLEAYKAEVVILLEVHFDHYFADCKPELVLGF